jgi:hypothetical protein
MRSSSVVYNEARSGVPLEKRIRLEMRFIGNGCLNLSLRRRDFRPLHVDIDPTPTTIEQRSWDFREISSVRFAFAGSETDLKTGKVLETSQIKSIKINPAIDPSFFEKL